LEGTAGRIGFGFGAVLILLSSVGLAPNEVKR
jgi:hypothetical protein